MKHCLNTGLVIAAMIVGPACVAQGNADPARRCNLQGREIALRISEEVSGRIAAEDRAQIAAIAEDVCRDYAGIRGRGRGANLDGSAPGAVDEASVETLDEAEQEDKGLFGGLKIIDRGDRVERGGLKRP